MAVTVDAYSSGGSGTSGRLFASNMGTGAPADIATFCTPTAGATFLLVWVQIQDTPTGFGTMTVTWDQGGTNQVMTLIGSQTNTNYGRYIGCFGLVNPTIGNKTLRIATTTSSGQNIHGIGQSLKGTITTSVAAATQGFAGAADAGSGGTVMSVTSSVAIPAGDLAFSFFDCEAGTSFTPPTDGGTLVDGIQAYLFEEQFAGAGVTITSSGTQSPSNPWHCGIVGVRAPSASVAVGKPRPNIFRPRQGPSRGLWTPRSTFIPSGTTASGDGASAGVGTVTGVGAALFSGVGSSSGVGTATGIGAGLDAATAASAGVGTVSGVGAALFAGVGSSSGVGAATATGRGIVNSVATSAGVASAAAVGDDGRIIPASRLTTWQPGVTYNGGIPNRTTIFATLSASGSDDTSAIQTAVNNAGAAASAGSPQVVLLNAGHFRISGNPIILNNSYVTLRGSGLQAAMSTGGNLANDSLSALTYTSGTWIEKTDRFTNPSQVVSIGRVPNWTALTLPGIALTADAVKGTNTCTVSSASGLSVGQLLVIDHVTMTDPNVAQNNNNNLSGYFTGSISGTALTVTQPLSNPTGTAGVFETGVDGTFVGSFSGTTLTVVSFPQTGYVQKWTDTDIRGLSIFDTSGNYKGYIIPGSGSPSTGVTTCTMSQSNTGTSVNLVIGGQVPLIGWPIFDSVFNTFYGFINAGTYPNYTLDQTNGTISSRTLTAGGGTRRQYSRQDRAVGQLMKISAIAGTTLTFETPFHYTFKTAYAAQYCKLDPGWDNVVVGIGVENLGMFGGMGGNFTMGFADSCWISHCECNWQRNPNQILCGYRCEVRDSFLHETPNPAPGGAGYLMEISQWASECLFENNICWQGNKVIVGRAAGGGNVIGYNHMDDSFGSTYPDSPEAGLNVGHQGTTPYALFEGNYCNNFQADSFWGSEFAITVHRNWLSGIRGCSPTGSAPTNSSTTALRGYFSGNVPYGDYNGRRIVDLQAGSYNHNFTGNVLGFSGQTLLSYNAGGYVASQVSFIYEELDVASDGDKVYTWIIGTLQQNGFQFVPTTISTVLRSGNWTWAGATGTGQQDWHGIGGSREYGGNLTSPFPTIPNSYYLTSTPAFFGGNAWPWVDPTTGATGTLPATARWNANTPNVTDVGNVAASSGTGTATGVGASLVAAVAASAGTGAATGVGRGLDAAVAASAGIGTATGVGAALFAGVAASTGLGTATGVGSFTVPGNVGVSAGIGTATAVGAWTADGIAASAGAGTALGVGQAVGIIAAVGSSAGTAIVLGISPALELPAGGAGHVMQAHRFTRKRWKELLELIAAEQAAAAKAQKVGSPARAEALAEAAGKAADAIAALEAVEEPDAYSTDVARLTGLLEGATSAKKLADSIREAKEAAVLAAKLEAEADEETVIEMLLDDRAEREAIERLGKELAGLSAMLDRLR